MTELIDRRYPIGKFEHGKTYSIDETRQQIKTIARLPKELKKALKKLRDGALDKPYRAGGWTARQVIHHLADSHMNAYVRFKLAATEDAPIIKPYEEKKWAETEDGKHGSAKTAIRLLTALHERWIDFITSLTDDELDRAYFHPANKRSVTLREAIALYAWHSKHHLAHVRLVIEGGKEKTAKADKREEAPSQAAKAAETKPAPQTAAPEAKATAPKTVAKAAPDSAEPAKKRTMSPEHRAKIVAAQQKRWAEAKGTAPAPAAPKAAAEPKQKAAPKAKAEPKQKAAPKADPAKTKATAPKAAAKKETATEAAPAKKRTMSPEHKAKIIAAQQKRWAEAKGTVPAPAAPKAAAEPKQKAAPQAKAEPKQKAAPKADTAKTKATAPKAAAKKETATEAAPAKKRTMSPEHKAKIIAAQQKRWAEQKAKK